MKKRIIGISSVVVLCAILVGVYVFLIKDNDTDNDRKKDKDTELTDSDNDKDEDDIIIDEPKEGDVVLISADTITEYGVARDSEFTLTHFKAVTLETVKKGLEVDPKVDFEVVEENDQQYKIKFKDDLPGDRIVKIRYKEDNELYGYGFQTEEPFWVNASYPAKNSGQVAVNTGVEISFSREIDENIEDYFQIEPAVAGTFKFESNKLIFVPSTDLEYSSEYTITIKDGYTKNNEVLEGMEFGFSTDWNDHRLTLGDQKISVVSADDYQVVKVHSWDDINYDDMEFDIYRIDSMVEEYLKLGGHKQVMNELAKNQSSTFVDTTDVELITLNYQDKFLILQKQIDKGLYYLALKDDVYQTGCFVQVTNKNAYLTIDEDECLFWIAEQENESVEATLYLDNEYLGETSGGIANIQKEFEQNETSYVKVETIDETLYLPTYVREAYDYNSADYYNYIYTDRELYLPTDTIHTMGYVKGRLVDTPQTVTISYFYNDEVLFEEEVELSPTGMFESSYNLVDFENDYISLQLKVGDVYIDGEFINVAAFEKPTYKLEASIDKEYIMQGDIITLSAEVGYYDGTPLKNSEIELVYDNYGAYFEDEENNNLKDRVVESTGTYTESMHVFAVGTEGWRPTSVYVNILSHNLESFYSSLYLQTYVFPKTMMIEVESESDGNTIAIDANCHQVDISKITTSIFDENQYRGNVISNQDLTVRITETYYEKVFLEQRYSEIYKETYDVYDFIRHEDIVFEEDVVTDLNGNIHVDFDQRFDNRYYSVDVIGVDANGALVVETNWNGYNMNYDDELSYSLYCNTYDVPVNETVTMELMRGNESIPSTEGDQLLIIEEKDGINDYFLLDETEFDIYFDKSKLPDTHYRAIYFNGKIMVSDYMMERHLKVDYSSVELSIEPAFDKDKYEPGDTVNYSLKVTDSEGNPVQADVNISVVDEAFFAVAEDYSDPLDDLFSSLFNQEILGSYFMALSIQSEFGAEQGGEGGVDGLRSEFENTAFFDLVQTDVNGQFEGSFILPDNITSWRVTLTAFNDEPETGKVKANIQSGLSFFGNVICEDKYLEGDYIYVTTLTAGGSEFYGLPVTMELQLLNSQGDVLSTDLVESMFGDYQSLEIGELPIGQYDILVEVTSGDAKDTSKYSFEVTDSITTYQIDRQEIMTEDTRLESNNNFVTIEIYNQAAYDIYKQIRLISFWKDSISYTRSISGYLSEAYIEEVFNHNEVGYMDFYQYFGENGYIKELENGEGDIFLTARLLSVGFNDLIDDWQKEAILERVESYSLSEEELDEEHILKLWIATCLDKAYLEEINEAADRFSDLESSKAQLALIATLIEAGQLTRANQLFPEFIESNNIDLSKDLGSLVTDEKENELMRAMLLGIAVKLERWDIADAFVDYLFENVRKTMYLNKYVAIEPELYYYFTKVELPVIDALVEFSTGQETFSEVLNYLDHLEMTLSSEEAEAFKVTNLVGELVIDKEYVGYGKDLATFEANLVSRSYRNAAETYEIGDVITIDLTFERDLETRGFYLQEGLPAGLEFYKIIEQENGIYFDGKAVGDTLEANIWIAHDKNESVGKVITVSYQAIAVAGGTYHYEPTYIESMYDDTKWVGESSWVEVEPFME